MNEEDDKNMHAILEKAQLLKLLSDSVFEDPDIMNIVKKYIDCESIVSFCLVNTYWCEKVISSKELRNDVARCCLHFINKSLFKIYDDMKSEIRESVVAVSIEEEDLTHAELWNNTESGNLFIHLSNNYFGISINLDEESIYTADQWLALNQDIIKNTKSIAKLLSLLFGVSIEHEKVDTDLRDPQHFAMMISFSQPIPDSVIRVLPFAKLNDDDRFHFSMFPVDDTTIQNWVDFDKLLIWPHRRRSKRRNNKSRYG